MKVLLIINLSGDKDKKIQELHDLIIFNESVE